MKNYLLLLIFMPLFVKAGVFHTENVQTYPVDWPPLTGMSKTCAETQGVFVDPNVWHWEHEDKATGSKYGGTRQAAWAEFGFSGKQVQSENTKIKSRLFTVAIDADQLLTISYLIDEKIVASKYFSKNKWSCSAEGLTVTIMDRSGVVMDKIPNKGRTITHSTLYKFKEHLYIKTTTEVKAKIFHLLPTSALYVKWWRFAQQT
jgi:hypothetical protein